MLGHKQRPCIDRNRNIEQKCITIHTHVDNDINEHNIDQPLSLTNKLFLEDSSDQTILPTTLEEDTTLYNKSTNTEPVSLQTMDEIVPQTNGDDLPPIFSQTQSVNNNSHAGSDNEESPIPLTDDVPQFDTIATQLNNVFDDNDDYLSANLKVIIGHRSSNGILELKVEYTDG